MRDDESGQWTYLLEAKHIASLSAVGGGRGGLAESGRKGGALTQSTVLDNGGKERGRRRGRGEWYSCSAGGDRDTKTDPEA